MFRPDGKCILLVTDIAGYGALRTRAAQEKVRADHYRLLEDCLEQSGIQPTECYMEDRGDGILVAIPGNNDPLVLVSSFVETVRHWLQQYNVEAKGERRIRLRVALHIGDAHYDGRGLAGTDVTLVFRIIESGTIKNRLRESSKALGFAVSDTVYKSVIEPARKPVVDPTMFDPISIHKKETHTVAWLQLRGSADPNVPADLCPYPGLAPFGLDNARWFFGRERVTAELLQRLGEHVRGTGPLIVVGPSGVGKSSLLRAGMLHALRSGNLAEPGSVDWPRLVFTPTAEPLLELAGQLAEYDVKAPKPSPGQTNADTHGTDRMSATGPLSPGHPSVGPPSARPLSPGRPSAGPPAGDGPLVIVVDQFEEIFTLCSDESVRQGFIRALCALAAGRAGGPPRALVVLGLRASWLEPCMAYPELVAALRDDLVYLEPMRPAELRDAIEKPAKTSGLGIEPGLVEILLRDLGVPDEPTGTYAPSALPLLSHALRATWQQCGGRALTVEGYQITGSIGGAVAKTAERVYKSLDSAQQETARQLLLHMIKITKESEIRRQVDRTALVGVSADPEAAAVVIERLASERLITLYESTVEICHDTLLREWPQLREWIDANRAMLLLRQRLTEDAEVWAHERRPEYLYRGHRLEEAQALGGTEDHGADLGAIARTFLGASADAEAAEHQAKHRRARRLHQLVVGLAVLSVLAILTSVVAVEETQVAAQQRNQALSGQVASDADTLRQSQPELALLLSVQAFRIDQSLRSLDSLLSTQARYHSRRLTTNGPAYGVAFTPGGQAIISADGAGADIHSGPSYQHARHIVRDCRGYATAVSADGRFAAVACQDGNVILWRADDDSLVVLPAARHGPVNAVAFSPDGRMLAGAGFDGVIRLWDVATRRIVHRLYSNADPGPVESVAFSPNGRTLASAGAGPQVLLWDVGPGSIRARLSGHVGPVRTVAFSPGGRLLASGGDDGAVIMWDVASGALVARLGGHIGAVRAVAFSQNGRLLASGGEDASLRLWDVASHDQLASLTGTASPVADVAFSPDGGMLAGASVGGGIELWGLGAMGGGSPVTASAMTRAADGSPVLATAGTDRTITLWEARTGLRIGIISGLTMPANALAYSRDGQVLAAAEGGSVATWRLSSGGSSVGGPEIFRGTGQVSAVAISPDGRTVAAASGGSVTLWNLHTGRFAEMVTPSTNQIDAIAFSPDGRSLATGSDDGTVTLTHVTGNGASATSVTCTGHLGSVTAFAFSLRGDLLASASTDRTVKLWTVPGCVLRHTFTDHIQAVMAVAFSSGDLLASAGEDANIDVWNVSSWRTGMYQEIASLSGWGGNTPPAAIMSLMFGPARGDLASADLADIIGADVISADASGRPVVWDINPQRVIDRICQTRPTLPSDRSYAPQPLPAPC